MCAGEDSVVEFSAVLDVFHHQETDREQERELEKKSYSLIKSFLGSVNGSHHSVGACQ